jgi:hypothetical protein
MNFVKSHKGLVFGGAAILVVIIVIASIIGSISSIRNAGIDKETRLNSQYSNNQVFLSDYTLKFNESLGIADRQSSKLNKILQEAIQGRYENLQPGTSGSMFSAIQEAYPDLTASTESYAKVQDLVMSGRTEYRNQQVQLNDLIRDYDAWRQKGFWKSFVVGTLGLPTDELRVTIGDKTLTGREALNKMRQPVLTNDAVKAYETGTQQPLISPEDDSK